MKCILTVLILLFTTSLINGQNINEDFESYSLGLLGPQSNIWTTWTGIEGTYEDGIITDELAASGSQSLLLTEGSDQDVVLLLGNQMEGDYTVSWMNYIPSGSSAYYNFQESENPAVAWNLTVWLNLGGASDGVADMLVNDTDTSSFTFPHDEWFAISHYFDLTNNTVTLSVNGTTAYEGEYEGNVGALDFFSIDEYNRLYVDDISISDETIGIDEMSHLNLNIFPNPNKGSFAIINQNNAGLYTLKIFNLLGESVLNEVLYMGEATEHEIKINEVNPGIYLVQLLNEENVAVRSVQMVID